MNWPHWIIVPVVLPLIAGELVTSATRSSSVAPLGKATVTSHTAAPLLFAIATSLPPGNPASVTLPTGSTPTFERSDRDGVLR